LGESTLIFGDSMPFIKGTQDVFRAGHKTCRAERCP
jgi:hypothetical protein